MATAFLAARRIRVGYGDRTILTDIDLDIAKGEFVALLGPSGCGKTTLLRAMAGFVQPSHGQILIDGADVTHVPPDRRNMALVFQSYALWPHMTVAQNIGYGLKLRGLGRREIAARVDSMLAMLGLEGLGDRKPAALSGGQRQRVALGRALAVDPSILLLDEPLSNLDARIRLTVRHEIRALQQRLGITAIHVTHDREEAMVMADRIVILDGGRIVQAGTPQEIFNRPANAFVAAFMGAENVVELEGVVSDGRCVLPAGPLNLACAIDIADRALASGPVEARFRGEAAELLQDDGSGDGSGDGSADALVLKGRVTQVGYPGGLWRHSVLVGGATLLVDAPHAFGSGDAVRIRVPPDALFLFPRAGASGAPVTHPVAA